MTAQHSDVCSRPARVGCSMHMLAPRESLEKDFKQAMRRLCSTVSIIATNDGNERFGMVATSVNAVSTDPPAVLVCINHSASIFQPLLRRESFSVNMLMANQSDLVSVFSGKVKGPERFEHGAWADANQLPFLSNGQATLFCRLDGRFSYGGHEVLLGRVEATVIADKVTPLLWQDGKAAISHVLDV